MLVLAKTNSGDFLDGGLGALGDVWIEVHLEHCAGCRQRLAT